MDNKEIRPSNPTIEKEDWEEEEEQSGSRAHQFGQDTYSEQKVIPVFEKSKRKSKSSKKHK